MSILSKKEQLVPPPLLLGASCFFWYLESDLVRDHPLQKIPLIFAVGAKEAETGEVAVRTLGSDKNEVMGLDAAIARIQQ